MRRPALFLLLLSMSCCSAGQELPLYTGAEYTGFYHGVNGHPFYQSDSLLTADLMYDDILYKNIRIGFNIADNEVYIKEPQTGYAIRLVREKIAWFNIDGHSFVRHAGIFYEITYRKGVKVYAHHFKMLKQAFRPEDPMIFRQYTKYYKKLKEKIVSRSQAVNPSSPNQQRTFNENLLHEIGTANQSSATHFFLAGYVRDAKTGEAVIGANVSADTQAVAVTTDQFGYYSIKLAPGKHRINVSGAGIVSTKRQIDLRDNGKLDIEVTPAVGSLRAVVVVAEKNSKVRNPQMSVEKLTIKNIKQVPVAFGEADVLRVVTTLPGVSTVGEGGTGFNVRGGSSDQNLILFNEATIYNPSHLFGFFSAFHPDIIKSVELYKSSIPEKYGGRLSSVLDIVSKEGNSKQIAGTGGIGPLTSKLTAEGPIGSSTTFIASGRVTYSNWLLRALKDERYSNSAASFQDISLNITHKLDKINSIYLTGYYSNDKFSLNSDTAYRYGNKNVNVKWKHIFNNKLFAVVTGGYDKYDYSIQNVTNPVNAFRLGFDINQLHFRTAFSYAPSNSHVIDFGVHGIAYKLRPGSYEPASGESIVEPEILQTEKALETAVYLGDKYTINPNFSVNAGIRYSFFEMWHAPEFRIAGRYSLSEISSIKLAFNTTRQYIHMLSNTAIISPADTWKLSDKDIKPQRAYQVSAGYYRNFHMNSIETSAEIYYKQIRNLLDYKSGAQLIMNENIAEDVIGVKGRSYGLELMIRKPAGKVNGWISYTYSRTFLQQNDSLAGERINKGNEYAANFDKPHILNVIGNYRFTHRFSLSLNIIYTSGRPVTVPVAIFNLGGSQRVYYSERNQYRMPDYFRADASFTIEGNHKINQKAHNSWSFGAYNILARKNPYSVYFKQENGVIKGYQLSIFGSIIPFVTYNFRF